MLEREREEKWKKMESIRVGKDGEIKLTILSTSPTKTNPTEKEEEPEDDSASSKPEEAEGEASPAPQEGEEESTADDKAVDKRQH